MSNQYPEISRPDRVSDCLQRAWQALKPNIWLVIGFTLLFYFALGILSGILSFIPYGEKLANVFTVVYSVSLYSAFEIADGGGELRFSDFFRWAPRAGRLLLGSIIMWAVVAALVIPVGRLFGISVFAMESDDFRSLTVSLGFVGLIGLVLAIYGILSFAVYFLLLKRNLSIGETLALSVRTGLKQIGPIIVYGLLSLGLMILAVMTCGIGLLLVLPLLSGVKYFLLLSIFPDPEVSHWDFEQTGPPPSRNY